MKIKVTFQERTAEYNTDTDITSLSQITQKLCSLFLITNYYAYSLFLSNGQIIDNLNLIEDGSEIIIKHLNKLGQQNSISSGSTGMPIPSTSTTVHNNNNNITTTLSSSPSTFNNNNNNNNITIAQNISIDTLLNNLKDNVLKKKAFFDLKDLKEELLIRKFVEKNGIDSIITQLKELTGNTLSYALSALLTIVSYEFGLASIQLNNSIELNQQILPLTENSNPSISKTSLSLLCLFLSKSIHSVEIYKQIFKLKSPSYIKVLVQLLGSSSTVDIQLNSLTLINNIINKTLQVDGEIEFNKLLAELDSYDINPKLKKLVEGIIAPELKRQLYIYQRHRFQVITNRKNVTFNKESPEHDALLMKLWNLTFPGVKLESRVSEQWKLMGFQGTDPCTDFRGMGIFGLDNLVYFAEHYGEKFRKIVNGQVERKEREYPTATAGIVITFELYNTIFKMGDKVNPNLPIDELPLFPLFFSHPNAFEEVYCTTFQILDSTWDDMNGSYMYFQKIISSVKNLIISALESKPTTLEAFEWKCPKNNLKQNGLLFDNNSHHNQQQQNKTQSEDVKKLCQQVNKEVLDTIKIQKTQYLLDGFQFKLYKPIKSKSSIVLNYINIKLDNNSNLSNLNEIYIQYCLLPSLDLDSSGSKSFLASTNYNTVKILDLNFISESTSNSKKKDKNSSSNFHFTISIKDDQFQQLITQPINGSNNFNDILKDNNNNNINSNNSNNNNNSLNSTPNNSNPTSLSSSPIMIPQNNNNNNNNNSSNNPPLSPSLLSMSGGMIPPSSPTSSGVNSASTNTFELVTNNREDLCNFWDSIRLLSNQDIKSPEGSEDYLSLLNINTSLKLLDLEGIDIPSTQPQIPPLPEEIFSNFNKSNQIKSNQI